MKIFRYIVISTAILLLLYGLGLTADKSTKASAPVTPQATTPSKSLPTPAAPTITGISPTRASRNGGTLITVTGTHFTGATVVMFGGNKSNTPTVISDTELTVIAPPGNGTMDVMVITPAGRSGPTAAAKLTYGD